MELIELKGVGSKRLAQLADAGIFSVEDLVNYFPKKYYNFTDIEPFAEDDKNKVILAKLVGEVKVVRFKKMNYAFAKMRDSFGNVFSAVWYNQQYIKAVLIDGFDYYLYGKNNPKKKNTFVVSLMRRKDKITEQFLPIYKKIGSFGSQNIASLIEIALKCVNFDSVIDQNIENEFEIERLNDAYYRVHKPNSSDEFRLAKKRIDIERLVPLAVKNLQQKVFSGQKRENIYTNLQNLYVDFAKKLPFVLTNEQKQVIYDIIADLYSQKSMNRLVQGEVGSGKTMLAFFAIFAAVKNGYQAAMIAPTEILARQHYEKIKKVFSGTGINIVLLTSELSTKQKREILRDIKLGITNVVIGTHSVIGDAVSFKNLSLAVIDEQHRFGVVQRAKLSSKGSGVDVLLLSATPIPRTMAIVLYGDLDLSIIKNCPFKKDITTNIVTKNRQLDMWKFVADRTRYGSRVFVVCANIGEDDDENQYSATNVYKNLQNYFEKSKIALLHGKQSKEQISQIMTDFATGKIQVLVATTVVEVGVDVPEADIMVIVSPDKFGLATLHQLRGRVGRNGEKSFCFCLSNDLSVSALERVKFFRDHDSGFDIAEYDYANRGSGDIYGTNQHGLPSVSAINLQYWDIAAKIAERVVQNPVLNERAMKIAQENYAKLCNDIVMN